MGDWTWKYTVVPCLQSHCPSLNENKPKGVECELWVVTWFKTNQVWPADADPLSPPELKILLFLRYELCLVQILASALTQWASCKSVPLQLIYYDKGRRIDTHLLCIKVLCFRELETSEELDWSCCCIMFKPNTTTILDKGFLSNLCQHVYNLMSTTLCWVFLTCSFFSSSSP